ncbi:MAG TPA: CPBP family intramembrane metalloprotease [Halanaerobiaceae bacterium]|jgi:membrane protease YdiL (CAAX protease family)|nr:CPBP family intramembrane metalloprotease [Halanaerobiaceae bacterium]
MIGTLISAILQLTLALVLALIFYFISRRKEGGFFNWLGLYLPKDKKWIKSTIIVFLVSLLVMSGPQLLFERTGHLTPEILYDENIRGKGLGISTLILILLKAVIQTSLSEEILFRGLIGKRLANKFGYLTGNIIQAILFGLPHGLPFIIIYKYYLVGITFIITSGIVGYLLFWLNEKNADGSLIPGTLIHIISNTSALISSAIS